MKVLRRDVLFGLLFVTLYNLPLFVLGQDSYLTVYDNLDSLFSYFRLLNLHDLASVSRSTPMPMVFNGLPRVAFNSEWSYLYLFTTLFGSLGAYMIMQELSRFIAFFGLYKLLQDDFPEVERPARFAAAVCFSFLPYWPMSQLTTAGVPLAFWALLRLRNGQKSLWPWLALAALPFGANFFVSFMFVIFLFGLLFLYDLFRHRRFDGYLFLALTMMSAIYGWIERRLVLEFVSPSFVSHREALENRYVDFSGVLSNFKSILLQGHYHAPSVPKVVVYTAIATMIIVLVRARRLPRHFIFLTSSILIFGAIYGLWNWQAWASVKEQLPVTRALNFSRFFWLLPAYFYLLFAICLSQLWSWKRAGQVLFVLALAFQLKALLERNEIYSNWRKNSVTFRQFYSESLMGEIRDFINRPQGEYRVVSLGLEPVVAAWNGFYVLDFYASYYPLSYKNEFREVIAPELAQSENLTRYYDQWGSRVYLFSHELGEPNLFQQDQEIQSLSLNFEKLYAMGGRYLLSGVRMRTPPKNLKWLKTFAAPSSAWKIDLYEIQP